MCVCVCVPISPGSGRRAGSHEGRAKNTLKDRAKRESVGACLISETQMLVKRQF